MMIESVQVVHKGDYVLVKWKKPHILPQSYTLKGACHYVCSAKKYTMPEIEVPGTRIVTAMPVKIGCECEVTLLATYNPASIDSGITTRFDTPTKSELISIPM